MWIRIEPYNPIEIWQLKNTKNISEGLIHKIEKYRHINRIDRNTIDTYWI